jgi:hypothetical protein
MRSVANLNVVMRRTAVLGPTMESAGDGFEHSITAYAKLNGKPRAKIYERNYYHVHKRGGGG